MVYEPKTSPLQVHLCIDQSKDHCEMACAGPVAWDLDAPMHEAGATAVQLVQ
jgi:hypothetical protein